MASARDLNRWFMIFKAKQAPALRLLCFPYGGGGSSIFSPWRDLLPDNVEICAAQLPGRQSRFIEPPFTRIQPLVAQVGVALLPLLDKPFALFGHSMGALLSFEIVRWLRRNRKLMPVALFVSGHRAPHIPRTTPALHLADDATFIAEMRKLNGTPEEVLASPELCRMMLPALRADTEICERYHFVVEEALRCPIIAYCGIDDRSENVARMDAWRLHTKKGFSLRTIAGDHFFLHSNQRDFLELLNADLNKLIRDSTVANLRITQQA